MKRLTEHEFSTMARMNCTKAQVAEKVLGSDTDKIDYAMPQAWLEGQARFLMAEHANHSAFGVRDYNDAYDYVRVRCVWSYIDNKYGEPLWLTEESHYLMGEQK